MKALVVYDSVYGNTEQIARAIAETLSAAGEVKLARVSEVDPSQLASLDLLVVGSPTQGGNSTKATQGFLARIPADALKNVSVTAFDTRVEHFVARLFGYASKRIVDSLQKTGGRLAASPEGFIVMGREGPLKEGELERASDWAKGIAGTTA